MTGSSQRVKARAPRAKIDGVLISPMVKGGTEMILGVQNDAVFGPVVMLGLGGIFVEVLRDVTFRIAPFGVEEAHNMIRELRGAAILEGARGQPPCDIDALADRFVEALGVCRGAEGAVHEHRRQPAVGAAERPGRGGARCADPDPIRRRER